MYIEKKTKTHKGLIRMAKEINPHIFTYLYIFPPFQTQMYKYIYDDT